MAKVNNLAVLSIEDALRGVAAGTSGVVGEVFYSLSKEADRFVKNQRRTLDPALKGVAEASSQKALQLQGQRQRGPSGYRSDERLTGTLDRALRSNALARVQNGKLYFADIDKLSEIAYHLKRVNFGTESPSGHTINSFSVDGTVFPVPVNSLYGWQQKRWTMPQGYFVSNGAFMLGYSNDSDTTRINRGTPAGTVGQFFLSDAGVFALQGSTRVYKQHIEKMIDKTLTDRVQRFATYNIAV